jgi:YHS domain-containing protein
MDPVCQSVIDEKQAPTRAYYEGEPFYFCSLGCKSSFEQNPEKYLSLSKDLRFAGDEGGTTVPTLDLSPPQRGD